VATRRIAALVALAALAALALLASGAFSASGTTSASPRWNSTVHVTGHAGQHAGHKAVYAKPASPRWN
jgi:hypothetical protein